MSKTVTWIKMLVGGSLLCIGGPALVYYVTPTEEEIFKKYNPELQKRSLETRQERQEDFDAFVTKLKEYSKSDKPIWLVAAEEENKRKASASLNKVEERKRIADEIEKRRQEVRNSTAS